MLRGIVDRATPEAIGPDFRGYGPLPSSRRVPKAGTDDPSEKTGKQGGGSHRSPHLQFDPAVGHVVLALHDPVGTRVKLPDHDVFDRVPDQIVLGGDEGVGRLRIFWSALARLTNFPSELVSVSLPPVRLG